MYKVREKHHEIVYCFSPLLQPYLAAFLIYFISIHRRGCSVHSSLSDSLLRTQIPAAHPFLLKKILLFELLGIILLHIYSTSSLSTHLFSASTLSLYLNYSCYDFSVHRHNSAFPTWISISPYTAKCPDR